MQQVKVPDTVYEEAKEVQDSREFSSLGDAIRYLIRNGEHDV